jgi:hypothetical protein
LNVRITKAAGTAVIASQQFGRLYSSPLQLQRFEVDAGATNRSNIRLEGHAVFAVERTSAAVRIMPVGKLGATRRVSVARGMTEPTLNANDGPGLVGLVVAVRIIDEAATDQRRMRCLSWRSR